MRGEKYFIILLVLSYLMGGEFSYALAPQSRFEKDLSSDEIPNILTSNMDKKNNWYFLSGDKNPFTYVRSRKNDSSKAILEIGTVTNYLSLFEFEGVLDLAVDSLKSLETQMATGTQMRVNLSPVSGDMKLNLKYLNDGRAFRDLNRMFSGVDPRALKDILDLLNREDNPYKATPLYTISPDSKTVLISMQPTSKTKERTIVKMDLPDGYNFVAEKDGVEKTINLSDIAALLGTDKDLQKSYETFLHNLKTKDSKWFAERNISYDDDKGEIYFKQSRVSLRAGENAGNVCALKVSFADNFNIRPEAVDIMNIFTDETFRLIGELGDDAKLKDLYTGAISLTKMLVTDNTVLAGVPNYITYFGRDTLYTMLFLFNHFNPQMQEHFLQQVISRASVLGECAHEVDTRYDPSDDRHYDYRMADSDFIFSTAILRYMGSRKQDHKSLEAFMSKKDVRNRFGNANGEVVIRNLNYVLNLLEEKNLLGIKRENDPSSGNWRDALNSLGRGKYPYDVNCVWPQKIIYYLDKIMADDALKEILLSYDKDETSMLSRILNNPKKLVSLKEKWNDNKQKFRMELSLGQWREKLKHYYADDLNDQKRIDMLHKMPIGKDKEGKVLYAYDFIYSNVVPVSLPNGDKFPEKFITYSMALDGKENPSDVVHSDLSIEPLFYDDAFYKSEHFDKSHYESIFQSYTLPIALGGLGVYNRKNDFIGFVVANPMLADKDGYDLVLTPSEDAEGVTPESLSPWQLLNPDSYHGMGAVWSFQKDFYTIACAKLGLDLKPADFEQLYSKEEQIRPEIFTVDYVLNDFDLKYKSEIEGLSINPCQLWNTAIISVISNQMQNQNNDFINRQIVSDSVDNALNSRFSNQFIEGSV